MKELQEIINSQVKSLIDGGTIKKLVEDGVSKAIEEAFEGQFRSYGNITTQIKKTLDDHLKIDESQLEIPTYNHVMQTMINSKVNEYFHGEAMERFKVILDKAFAPLPDKMKLHDFLQLICDEWKTDDPCGRDDLDEYMTVEYERRSVGYYAIKLWNQKKSSYSSTRTPDMEFTISSDRTIMGRHRADPYFLGDVDGLVFKAFAQGIKFTDLETYDPVDESYVLQDKDY